MTPTDYEAAYKELKKKREMEIPLEQGVPKAPTLSDFVVRPLINKMWH